MITTTNSFEIGTRVVVQKSDRVCSDYWGLEAVVEEHGPAFGEARIKGWSWALGIVPFPPTSRVRFDGADFIAAQKVRGCDLLSPSLMLEESFLVPVA
jgi:hypothetical protein